MPHRRQLADVLERLGLEPVAGALAIFVEGAHHEALRAGGIERYPEHVFAGRFPDAVRVIGALLAVAGLQGVYGATANAASTSNVERLTLWYSDACAEVLRLES